MKTVTHGNLGGLGTGDNYPWPFAHLYQSDGMGYRVYQTQNEQLSELVAVINIEPMRNEHGA